MEHTLPLNIVGQAMLVAVFACVTLPETKDLSLPDEAHQLESPTTLSHNPPKSPHYQPLGLSPLPLHYLLKFFRRSSQYDASNEVL